VQIDKTCSIAAPIEVLWKALLDPDVIARCLPGVERVEAIDPTRFKATVAVKVGIVHARFAMDITILETRPPRYLKSAAVGDAAGMAGSVRGTTEVTLEPVDEGQTRVGIRAELDVFGRLGTFGYSVLKGKVDRMWQDFARNLAAAVGD
jgi:uncharacterized protein